MRKIANGRNRGEIVYPRQQEDDNVKKWVACVAWRFCRAERRSGVAAKFAREAARKIKTACPDSWPFQLPPPSTHFDILLTTCLVSVFPANRK